MLVKQHTVIHTNTHTHTLTHTHTHTHHTQEILNTEGVYLAKIVRNGLCVYRWYDISDYEYYGSATSTHAKKGRGTGEQLTLRNRAEPRDGRGVTDQEDDSDVLRNVDVDDSFKVQDRNHFSPLLSLMMLDSKHLLHSNLHQVYLIIII